MRSLRLVSQSVLVAVCLSILYAGAPALGGIPCNQTFPPTCGGDCNPGQTCVQAGAAGCACQTSGFPPGGTDLSPSVGTFRVNHPGIGPIDVQVAGNVQLAFSNPFIDPLTGQRVVQTEMLALNLTGQNPTLGSIRVRAGTQFGLPQTTGRVVPLGPGADFPALAFFDVFFEVDLGTAVLRNDEPLVMQAEINEIPPRALGLRNAAPVDVAELQNPSNFVTLQNAQHWMCPPPFPPAGVPCGVPCGQSGFPVCGFGSCPPAQQCVAEASLGSCRCAPAFPPTGTDLSPSTGIFQVDVQGVGSATASVSGEMLLQWSDPQHDPVTGERTVQTEILSMDLSGFDPQIGSLSLQAGSTLGLPQTLGVVTPIGPGSDFPALATFDVFFDVDVLGVTGLSNPVPLVMQATITEIPPRAIALHNQSPVLLEDEFNPNNVSILQTALHWMCPPPFPPQGVPCPVPCNQSFPLCGGDCPLGGQCVTDPATGGCDCRSPFPGGGTDLSPSTGIFRVDVPGLGEVDTSAAGDLLLQWSAPQTDPATGERSVQTEMLSMDLSGSHAVLGPVNVRAGGPLGLPATLGSVTPLTAASDFPALATFDVFFEVEVQGLTLRNDEPLVMQAEIDEIPPRNLSLRNLSPVLVTNGQSSARLQTAGHWMCPPPFPPSGVPCPVPCSQSPFPVCEPGTCGPGDRCVAIASAGACRCVGDFPPAGTDLSPSTGIFRVDVPSIGEVDTSVAGPLLLQWQDPAVDPVSGERTVQTEMLSMDLTGSHPSLGTLNVRAGSQHGLPPTLGSVTPLGPGSDFPALATFDVFFEVEVLGLTLRNSQPLVMHAEISEIPPRNIGLSNLLPVLISDGQSNAGLQTALHWMCPPPFPPAGVPCPVPCSQSPFPVCSPGDCPPDQNCVADPAGGVCRCVDNFPPNGFDLSPTTGIFRVDVNGVGPVDTSVSGDTLLQWQDPQTDPVTGERTVQTEMLSLDLAGSLPGAGPLTVRAGSRFGLPPTLGSVTPLAPGSDFPARATFDVFFEVEVAGVTLRNSEPLVMEADITEIPPRNLGLRNLLPVNLIDQANPALVSQLQTALHWMCPPPFPPPGVPCPVPCKVAPFPVCGPGDCPTNQECVDNPATQACECVPIVPPCELSDPATCGGVCPIAGDVCTIGAAGCFCETPPVQCELSAPDTCDGLCPDPNDACTPQTSPILLSPDLPPESQGAPQPGTPRCDQLQSQYEGQDLHALFPGGIDFSNPIHSCFENVNRQDDGSGNEVETFDSSVVAEVDLGGGPVPVTTTGPVSIVTYGKTGNTTGTFQTEMVSMSLTGSVGPVTVTVRESPTKASTGRTTITDVGGGQYQIDSFFDVFTEISIDGGPFEPQTNGPGRMRLVPTNPGPCECLPAACDLSDPATCDGPCPNANEICTPDPAGGPCTCETPPTACELSDPATCGGVCPIAGDVCTIGAAGCFCETPPVQCELSAPDTCDGLCPDPNDACTPQTSPILLSPDLPPESQGAPQPGTPRCDQLQSQYEGQDLHALFPGGIDFSNPIHSCFENVNRQDDGSGNEVETFDSSVVAEVDLGGGPVPVTTTGPVSIVTYGKTGNTTGTFQTEMVSMSLTGSVGPVTVTVRESPTKASTGRTTITDVGGGQYQIDSFFDVFTEISIDGGPFEPQTNGPGRMRLVPTNPGPCECLPAACDLSDPATCDGPCPNANEICTPDPAGGPCTCETPPTACELSDPATCGGVCPIAGDVCTIGAAGCRCETPPVQCELSAPDTCDGLCPDPNDACTPQTSPILLSPDLPPESQGAPQPGTPRCDQLQSQYEGQDLHALFPGGIDFSNPIHSCFENVNRQDDGSGNEVETFDSSVVAEVDLGGGPVPVTTTGPVSIVTYGKTGNTTGTFQTEMVSMSLTGSVGPVTVTVRESPTKASTGRTTITDVGGGQYQIDSFFDVFTEISIDGGPFEPQTNGPGRMRLVPTNPGPCECLPAACDLSDPATCDGPCPNANEICTPDPAGGPCTCETPPTACELSDPATCGGVCPIAGDVCTIGAAGCRCETPPQCEPVTGVLMDTADSMRWDASDCATHYNLYRQRATVLADLNRDGVADSYGSCYIPDIPELQVGISDDPPPGEVDYFQVTSEGPGGEGPLGNASNGLPRPNVSPCP